MLISTLVNIMCILAASDGYGCRSAETPKMKKMRHCKWINFVVILSIWIKPRYSILVNLLPKAGRTLDRVNLLIWLPPGAYHPEGRHGRWHSLVHLRTKILTWFKWLSVTKQDFARFCARFVFPLRNLAQNLARNLARKSCDRTGLSLVCLSSIATFFARGIIGRNIKECVNKEPPSYTTRRCSRAHRRRKTVPFSSYQCW